jgi:hypothetical protein
MVAIPRNVQRDFYGTGRNMSMTRLSNARLSIALVILGVVTVPATAIASRRAPVSDGGDLTVESVREIVVVAEDPNGDGSAGRGTLLAFESPVDQQRDHRTDYRADEPCAVKVNYPHPGRKDGEDEAAHKRPNDP